MTRAVFAALLSHWWRNPLQLFTLMSGLALATALWSGVQAINAEARASYDAAAATLGEGRFDQITRSDGGLIDQADYIALRRSGWLVSPVVEGRINGQRVIGIDPLTAPGGLGPVTMDGGNIAAFLGGTGQLFARQETFDQLGETGAEQVVSADIAPGTVITDIGIAQRILDQDGLLTRLIVDPVQPVRQAKLDTVVPYLTLQAARSDTDVGRLTDSFHLNLTAFGFLSFAVGVFIVHGAIGLAFEQRRGVVRTMRALGVPLHRLIVLICVELLVLALIAGVIGVALGYLIAAALLPDVAATLEGLYGANVGGSIALRPVWLASALAIALGGTLIAAGGALVKLVRTPLLASGQRRASAIAGGPYNWVQPAVAGALLLLAVLLALFGSGLVAGFALLGSLLLGAALALSMILSGVLKVGSTLARGPIAQWFWADTRQQVPGLSLALMALLLAMSTNIGVSTMVSSFRLTFVGFLDQVLNAELYVYTTEDWQDRAMLDTVSNRVGSVLPIMSTGSTLAGHPAEVFSARDDPTYSENWKLIEAIPDAWGVLARGDGVMINEQLFRRTTLQLGSDLVINADVTLPVIGVYGDYGNPLGQAIVTEELFRQMFPDVRASRFGLRMSPGDVAGLRADLIAAGLPKGNLINQSGIKAFSMSVFDRTFTVTTALNILTLAVAGFAILMSLLTLAALRVPQLAPVWALGLTRRQLGWLELGRAVLLAVLTGICALPVGLALAWVLLAVVNVEAFGWRLPMFVFPGEYARLGLFALVAATCAAAWPAWRLARTPPSDLLKVFSNER